ncbi:GDP-L-fucose synthase [Alphaproteobacteria bacterium]|nr:GDP-L-fucose synthase [Alphaproteobacteria bacterium]
MKTRVYVAGHSGMVGSALVRFLSKDRNVELICRSRSNLDLTNQMQVQEFFQEYKIDQVYLAAAKVGGIYANNEYPADFIYQNIIMQANVIHAAHINEVQKLLFLGSSCIYPKLARQPIMENALLTGALEPTNEPYAIAKIAGLKLCESYNRQHGRDYRSVMPTNLYGKNDNFHPENSHVIPALIRRFHEAKKKELKSVSAWGSGTPLREFLYVDDMAEASIFIMNLERGSYERATLASHSHINVGTGKDCTIRELTETIAEVVGYKGEIKWDESKPDGSPRKVLDVTLIGQMGWKSKVSLFEGLSSVYEWFLSNQQSFRSD